jgi:hypothetical protein
MLMDNYIISAIIMILINDTLVKFYIIFTIIL